VGPTSGLPFWFASITDVNGDATTVEREASGAVRALVARDGQRTELTLDVPTRCSDRAVGNTVTLTGTISNRPYNGFLLVGWGNRTVNVGTQSGGFQLTALPGTHDLFVTHVVPEGWPGWMARTWARVAEEVRAGRQVYVVCPRIGDDDGADEGTDLRAEVAPDEEDEGDDAPAAPPRR